MILPGAEVYPALERGVVDAIEWATPGINIGLGFHKVAKYIILPGVHQPGAVLECVFDKALWDSFDATTKTQIEAAAKMATLKSWMDINVMDVDALEKLKAEGVEFIRVDQSYIDGVAKATREWEDKYIAAEGGWFKKVVEHQRAFVTVGSSRASIAPSSGKPRDRATAPPIGRRGRFSRGAASARMVDEKLGG